MVTRRDTSRANPSASKVLLAVVYGLEEYYYHRTKMETGVFGPWATAGLAKLRESLISCVAWLVASLSLLSILQTPTTIASLVTCRLKIELRTDQ